MTARATSATTLLNRQILQMGKQLIIHDVLLSVFVLVSSTIVSVTTTILMPLLRLLLRLVTLTNIRNNCRRSSYYN